MAKLGIVITTHGKAEDLPLLLKSLELQREYKKGKCTRTGREVLWVAGERPNAWDIETIVTSDGKYGGWDEEGERFDRLVECPKEGAPGHHTRGPGIKAVTADFVTLTNSDNYYVQGFLSRALPELKDDVGFLYWNVVNNLWRWSNYQGSRLQRGHIDLSAAAVRTDVAKEVGFPFRNYDGDWDYFEACLKIVRAKKLRVVFLDETLGVHN